MCLCVESHDTKRRSRRKKMLRCVVRAEQRCVLLVCFCVRTSERVLDCIFIFLCAFVPVRTCTCMCMLVYVAMHSADHNIRALIPYMPLILLLWCQK